MNVENNLLKARRHFRPRYTKCPRTEIDFVSAAVTLQEYFDCSENNRPSGAATSGPVQVSPRGAIWRISLENFSKGKPRTEYSTDRVTPSTEIQRSVFYENKLVCPTSSWLYELISFDFDAAVNSVLFTSTRTQRR